MNIRLFPFLPLLVIILLICTVGFAQKLPQDFTVHHKVEDSRLYLRIQPNTMEAFKYLLANDIQVELYQVDGDLPSIELEEIDRRSLRSLSLVEWQENLSAISWDSIALTACFGPQLNSAFLQETFLSAEYEDTEASAWQHRWLFSNYALNFSWQAIERSGFGYQFRLPQNSNRIATKLSPLLFGDSLWIDIDQNSYQAPRVPELKAVFKDRRVELEWRTLEYRPYFFGWYLDRSLDGGKSWEPIFDLPLMNPHDTITAAAEALKSLYYEDILPDNEVQVQYRLQGADYLGGRSENISIVTGQGCEDIRVGPLLLETIQTDSNFAVIRWEYPQGQEAMLQEFRIYETDTTGQNYRLALEGIPASQREVVLPMKFEANFFRVQAVSKLGTELTSFESLVMSYDVTPPAIPKSFTGYIDSTGIAHFTWISSEEADLAGYYLFKGYFENQELAMITPRPVAGSMYTDTVDMRVGNEWVYYQLRSVDYRGNGSAFTPVLSLKKPDVFPPGASQFLEAKAQKGHVYLEWTESPSADANRYELYRRNLSVDTDFTLVHEFSRAAIEYTYIDSLLEPNTTYIYTMLVHDDDGLESEPSQPVVLRVHDTSLGPAIRELETNVVKNTIHISWLYSAEPMGFNIYRAVDDEPLILLKSVNGKSRQFIDEQVYVNRQYRYQMQAVFIDGRTSPFTAEVHPR